MRKAIAALAALLILLIPVASTAAEADDQAAVLAVMDTYNKAFQAGDVTGIMDLYARDVPVFGVGTGPGELLLGRQALERHFREIFSQVQGGKIQLVNPKVGVAGDAAWMASQCFMQMNEKDSVRRVGGFFSAALVRQGGKWRITQMHLSIPSTEVPYSPAR